MIYLACVVRGQLDPVFSFKDEHKARKNMHILKCSFSGLCTVLFNSHENYNTAYNTCKCTRKLYKK